MNLNNQLKRKSNVGAKNISPQPHSNQKYPKWASVRAKNILPQHETVRAKNILPQQSANDDSPQRGMEKHSPEQDSNARHNRRSIRLKGYDYSQAGAYFVTICTKDRISLFGEINDGEMILNDAGIIAEQCWKDIPVHFPNVLLDEWIIMPNHIHGIIIITVGAKNNSPQRETVGSKNISPQQSANDDSPQRVQAKNISPLPRGTSKTIGSIIRGFKIGVTKWMRQNDIIYHVWQRNYYEHIIRNEKDLHMIREYIVNNPLKWQYDKENPNCIKDIYI